MTRTIYLATILVTLPLIVEATTYASAQTEEEAPWYENNDQVPYPNNTAALGTGDNSADITSQRDTDLTGALKGEITLKQRDNIVEVFSNGNLVEQLVEGIGSTGTVTDASNMRMLFEPAGRPALECPAREHAGWFGPCTMQATVR
jgi:hypothetical protein